MSSFSLITGNFFGFLAAGIVYGISYDTSNTGWRAALAVTFIPATILLIALPFVPESPRFLYQHRKEEQCMKALCKLYGGTVEDNGDIKLSEQALTEFEAMKAAISWDLEHGQHKWSALYITKAARYRSFVAISSQCWWAWNGGSVFTYYYSKVYRAAGINNIHIIFGIASVQQASWCIGGIMGGYLLDIWGRRTNYLIALGQACLLLIIQGGLTLGIFDKGIRNHAAGAAFVSVYIIQWFLWVMFFSPGKSSTSHTLTSKTPLPTPSLPHELILFLVVNMLPAEIYSAGLRSRGYAIANVFSMAMGFASQYSALPMYESMHGWMWIFFSGCMAFAFLIVFFFYPETKGVSLTHLPNLTLLVVLELHLISCVPRLLSKKSKSSSARPQASASSRPLVAGRVLPRRAWCLITQSRPTRTIRRTRLLR